MKKDIHVAHSPDSDDAFMFYALATRKIDTHDLNYVHTLSDIETLNRKAMKGVNTANSTVAAPRRSGLSGSRIFGLSSK